MALDRSRPALPARLAGAAARRSPGHLGGGTRVPRGGDPFFEQIQDIYDEIGEGQPPGQGRPRPGELPDDRAEIEASGLFEVIAVRHYDWERVYQAEEYIELLDTFSGHLAMADWKRKRLYGEIRRRLAMRRDHSVRRHWGAVLHVARRREQACRAVRLAGPQDLAEELGIRGGIGGLVQEQFEAVLGVQGAERAA